MTRIDFTEILSGKKSSFYIVYSQLGCQGLYSHLIFFQEPLMLPVSNSMDENSGLKNVSRQIYGYRASSYLANNPHQELDENEEENYHRRRQHEDTSLVTNIVFFLLCLLILAIIIAIVWFRFLKPRFEKFEPQ